MARQDAHALATLEQVAAAGVSDRAFRVAFILTVEHEPSQTEIARLAGCGISSAKRALRELATAGFLEGTRMIKPKGGPPVAQGGGPPVAQATRGPGHGSTKPKGGPPVAQALPGLARARDSEENLKPYETPKGVSRTNGHEHPPAQTLVAYFIDRSRDLGANPPGRVKGQVARLIGELVAEGQGAERIQAGIDRMLDQRLHPATLPSCVLEAGLGPPTPRSSLRTTGWRLVRGSHGTTLIPDPAGTDRPPG